MPPAASRPLTDRQRDVMVRIDRRVPIKVIAQELGVSETRINQHIRALKDIFEAGSLNELVELYRSSQVTDSEEMQDLREAVYTKNQVPEPGLAAEKDSRADAGTIVMSDVMPLGEAPWQMAAEPQVVPGVLDGRNAILFRLVAIMAIFFGILASVVLIVTAGLMISEALEGKAEISEDYVNPAE